MLHSGLFPDLIDTEFGTSTKIQPKLASILPKDQFLEVFVWGYVLLTPSSSFFAILMAEKAPVVKSLASSGWILY